INSGPTPLPSGIACTYKRERTPCFPLHLGTSWEPGCTRTRKSHQFSQVGQRSNVAEEEKRKRKKQHLVQSPSSYFMNVKCPGCCKITTTFNHAQIVILCVSYFTLLCQPTRRKVRLNRRMLLQIKAALKAP
uniref:40S ribosomal protein S27-like n=1 Tax=Felis catus TaxID=9685 RepID=A0ABI8ALB8_FELCA